MAGPRGRAGDLGLGPGREALTPPGRPSRSPSAPAAGVCRSGRRSPAEPLEGRGCRVPASSLGWDPSAPPDPPQPGSLPGARPPSGGCERVPSLGVLSVFSSQVSTDDCCRLVGSDFPCILFGEFFGGPVRGPHLPRLWGLGT